MKPGSFVRQYQGSSHYLTGGSIPPLSTSHMTKGGVKTERGLVDYKCNKYPERYFGVTTDTPPQTSALFNCTTLYNYKGVPPMTININGADMATLTIFKMELQRNLDMNLQIDPIITKYMQGRISDIEAPPPKLSEVC